MQATEVSSPSKMTVPLFLGIAGTLVFDLLPIAMGFDIRMNGCFAAYAVVMVALSFADWRVLGYATILSACNPANAYCNISYSFLMAVITTFKSLPVLWQTIQKLSGRFWWLLLLLSFFGVGLSVPAWDADARTMVTEVKQFASLLGYLMFFTLAVGSTLRTPRDGVRAIFLLSLTTAGLLVVFHHFGTMGTNLTLNTNSQDVFKTIGGISMNFQRTQVCIILAMLAVISLALGVSSGLRLRATPAYAIMCACIYLILVMASTGSALAMVCGFAAVMFGYYGNRLSLGKILLGSVLFAFIGVGFYFAVIETDNMLSRRIEEKSKQLDKSGIDRMKFWVDGLEVTANNPLGMGFLNVKTGHSEWLHFSIGYGWVTSGCYISMNFMLLFSLLRSLFRKIVKDPLATPLLLAGLGGLAVYIVNSVTDMLSANFCYYETGWALILTSALVIMVSETNAQNEKKMKVGPQPISGMSRKLGC